LRGGGGASAYCSAMRQPPGHGDRGTARAACGVSPALVVVKENEAHCAARAGRDPAHHPRALLRRVAEGSLAVRMSEIEAARCALEWAQPVTLLALPVSLIRPRDRVRRFSKGHNPRERARAAFGVA